MFDCTCGRLDHLPESYRQIIRFDDILEEWQIFTPDGKKSMPLQFCFACGGKLPESKRRQLFFDIDESEKREAWKLLEGLHTSDDLIARLGTPDETTSIDEECHSLGFTKSVCNSFKYSQRWKTFFLIANINQDSTFSASLVPKPRNQDN